MDHVWLVDNHKSNRMHIFQLFLVDVSLFPCWVNMDISRDQPIHDFLLLFYLRLVVWWCLVYILIINSYFAFSFLFFPLFFFLGYSLSQTMICSYIQFILNVKIIFNGGRICLTLNHFKKYIYFLFLFLFISLFYLF